MQIHVSQMLCYHILALSYRLQISLNQLQKVESIVEPSCNYVEWLFYSLKSRFLDTDRESENSCVLYKAVSVLQCTLHKCRNRIFLSDYLY